MSDVSLGTISAEMSLPLGKFEAGRKAITDGLTGLQDLAKKTEQVFAKMELNPDRIAIGGEIAEKALQSLMDKVDLTKKAILDLNAQKVSVTATGAAAATAELQDYAKAVRSAASALGKLNAVKVDLANSVQGTAVASGKLTAFGDDIEALRLKAATPIVQKVSVVRTAGGAATAATATVGQRLGQAGSILANGATLVTAGAGFAAYDAAQFEYATQIQANNAQGMSAPALAKLRALSLALAAKTGQSPEDILAGGKQIQDFNFTAAETRQILPQAVNIATAQGGTVQDAGNALGAFMREFGYKASQAQSAADLIYRAVQSGNLNLSQFEGSFKRAGAVGANLGVNAPEALAMFSTMTQHGFTGSTSATQTRGFFETAMKTKTPAQDRAMAIMDRDQGTHLVRDFSPEGLQRLQPSALLKEIIKGAGGKGDPQLTQNLSRLFPNLRGFEGLLSLTGKGAADYQAKRGYLASGAGASSAGASAIEATGIGQIKVLTEQIQQKLIPLGQQLLPLFTQMVPALKQIADALTEVLKAFNGLSAPVKDAIIYIGAFNLLVKGLQFLGIVGKTGPLVAAFRILRLATLAVVDALPGIGAALATAGEAVAAFVAAVGAGTAALAASLLIAIAAIIAFVVAYETNFHHTRDVTRQFISDFKATMKYVPEVVKEEFGAAVSAIESFIPRAVAAGKAFVESIGAGIKAAGSGLVSGVSSVLSEIDDHLNHSDAKKGPLSHVTASGRALMTTLAAGVRSGAGALTSAVSDALGPAKSRLDADLDAGKPKKAKKTAEERAAEASAKREASARRRSEDTTYALTHTKAETERYKASETYGRNRDLGVPAGVARAEYTAQIQDADKTEEAIHLRHLLKLQEIADKMQRARERLAAFKDDLVKRLAGRKPTEHEQAVSAANAQADEDTGRAYALIGGSGPLPKDQTDLIEANRLKVIKDADDAKAKQDAEAAKESLQAAREQIKAADEEQKGLYESNQTTLAQYQTYLYQRIAGLQALAIITHHYTQAEIIEISRLQKAINDLNAANDRKAGEIIRQSGIGDGPSDAPSGPQGPTLKGTLADATGSAVEKAIEHWRGLKDALKSIQKSILDDLKQFLAQMIAQYVKSQLFGAALGGGNPFGAGGIFGGRKSSGTPPIAGALGGSSSGEESGSSGGGLMGMAQNWLMQGNNALKAGGVGAAGYGLYNAFHKKGKHGLFAKLGLLAGAGLGAFFGGATGAEYGAGLGSYLGGQFAAGGSPPLGKVSLVGEKGPELFVPRQAGTIIPADKTGSMLSKMGGVSVGALTVHHHGDINNQADMDASGRDLAYSTLNELAIATALS